jgi:hypothetical protein
LASVIAGYDDQCFAQSYTAKMGSSTFYAEF